MSSFRYMWVLYWNIGTCLTVHSKTRWGNVYIAGKFCASVTSASQNCANGYYSTGSAVTCTECPAGHECSDKTSPTPCNAGTYALAGQASCTNCADGYYSTGTAVTCTECPAGQECSDKSSPADCLAGTYALAGQPSCTDCPTGMCLCQTLLFYKTFSINKLMLNQLWIWFLDFGSTDFGMLCLRVCLLTEIKYYISWIELKWIRIQCTLYT